MDKKKRLIELTDSLLVHDDDRELWAVLVDVLAEKDVVALLAVLGSHPDKMAQLNHNLQSKLDTLLSCDQDEWQRIVDQEIALVKNS
ncbi:MAG: hypothetical protein WCO55_04720 [Candidatus Falkowbacteria bacterium]